MIDLLRQNIDTELKMLTEIARYAQWIEQASGSDAKLLLQVIEALRKSIKIVNSTVPQLLESVPLAQELPASFVKKIEVQGQPPPIRLTRVRFRSSAAEVAVALQERDRERFLRELSLTEQLVKKVRQKPLREREKAEEFRAARGYLRLSNRFFLPMAARLIIRGHFRPLTTELRRANIDILFATYVAMILFSTLLAFFVGLVIGALAFFLSIDLSAPFFIVPVQTLSLERFLKVLLIPLLSPVLAFVVLYYYPMTERSSLAKKIDQELPFAIVHMSAISGSGIEPTQIFKIIIVSREYPHLRREIRKVLNQINLYGYDLVTAINNTVATTPSAKLSDLFLGLSTTITSGGNLPDFFEKRAESLLITYRLERERYTKTAETFMDIYISLVIAAPMILMIILIIVSVAQLNIGIAPLQMTFFVILAIAIFNAIFLGFLHIRQPTY